MTSIDTKRFLIAGLVCGVVLNISGMISATLLGLGDAFARFEIVPDASGVLLHMTLRFCVGLAAAYAYVGMTPRFGPGARTAVRVGVVIWFIGYAPSLALLSEIGFLTRAQAVLGGAWGLVEACAAVAVAAALYRPHPPRMVAEHL